MQPYNVSENDWISKIPLTATGSVDVVALEAAARRQRAHALAALIGRLFARWKQRSQAAAVQRELDRAALGMGK